MDNLIFPIELNMKVTFEKLKQELEPYRNTLVLDLFKVVRLVDVIDGQDDYYWVYDTHHGIYHSSCVGGFVPLKGHIEQVEYNRLVNMWNLNNIEKAV